MQQEVFTLKAYFIFQAALTVTEAMTSFVDSPAPPHTLLLEQ